MVKFLSLRGVYILCTIWNGLLVKYLGVVFCLSVIYPNNDKIYQIAVLFLCGLILQIKQKKLLIITIILIILFFIFEQNQNKNLEDNSQNFVFMTGEIFYHTRKNGDQEYIVLKELVSGKLVLIKIKNNIEKFEIGQIVNCNGEAKYNSSNREYNYNVDYVVDDCKKVYVISKTNNPYISLVNGIRNYIDEKLEKEFSSRDQSFIKGILIGDTNDLPDYISRNFSTIGISHIVAVSGFNMNVVFVFVDLILRKIRKKIRYICITLVLTVYMSVIGINNIPALRAYIMIIVLIILKLSGKYAQKSSILALTVVVILLIFPRALASISFQLSFMATIGMMHSGKFEIKNKFEIKETIFAIIFTLPIIMYFFGATNLLSLFANIVILPFVGPLTYVSIIYLASPFNLTMLSTILALGIDVQMYMVNFFVSITNFVVIIDKGNLVVLSVLLFIVFIIIIEINYREQLE
jgi:competence protein ComEC